MEQGRRAFSLSTRPSMVFCWSGNTAFGIATFRYRVSVGDDHLVRIWLEEGVSKKQWRTARLRLMDDVATQDRFHVIGVAQHLINCFNASLDGQSNYFRELTAFTTSDALQLVMVYTMLREGNDEESLTYTFVLSPVIPRTIVSRTVEDNQHPQPNGVVVQLVSRETVQCDQFAKWAIVSGPSAHFELHHNNTLLAFAHGGPYSISLSIEHCVMRHDAVFELFVNYRCVQSLHWSVDERESITSLLEVQPNDVLGVSYRGRSVIPPVGLQVMVQIRQ